VDSSGSEVAAAKTAAPNSTPDRPDVAGDSVTAALQHDSGDQRDRGGEANAHRRPGSPGSHPLRGLPEIQVRHQQPHRATMRGGQRFALVTVDDPGLADEKIGHRDVGGVATVGTDQCEFGDSVDRFEKRVQRNAFPFGIQLGPGGDAVNADSEPLAAQSLQLSPRPPVLGAELVSDCESPVVEVDARSRPCLQDREVRGQMLTGWQVAGPIQCGARESLC
jgi:hypothetical protein